MLVNSKEIGEKDYEWALGLNRLSLNLIGAWPEKSVSRKMMRIMQVQLQIVTMVGGALMPQLYALTLVIKQLPLVIDNLFSNVGITASFIKLLILWCNKKWLTEITEIVKSDWYKQKEDWEREIMLKMAKRGRIITISGYVLMIGPFVGILVGPLLGLSFRAVNNITDHGNRFLPLQSMYPFESSKTPYFEMSFILQVASAFLACVCVTSPAALFSVLVYHMCGQIQILGIKIRNLPAQRYTDDFKASELGPVWDFHRTIAEIVKTHVNIIGTVTTVESYFMMLALVQISALSILMCCYGFAFINAFDEDGRLMLSQLVFVIGSFLNAMVHSFLYCLSAEALIQHSEDLFRSVTDNEWYLFPVKKARNLTPILLRTRYPLQMTAGKLIYLNLETFCNILKTTAGYISMLIAVRDK